MRGEMKRMQVTLDWRRMAEKTIAGEIITFDEGLQILQAKEEEILAIMDASYKVRHHYYGNKVKLNMIMNAKSGLCPEDCGYCSQSIVADSPIETYNYLDKET